MIKGSNIVQRFYTYYGKASTELNFSPLHGVELRNHCYLLHSMIDTYMPYRDRNSTTRIKRI